MIICIGIHEMWIWMNICVGLHEMWIWMNICIGLYEMWIMGNISIVFNMKLNFKCVVRDKRQCVCVKNCQRNIRNTVIIEISSNLV